MKEISEETTLAEKLSHAENRIKELESEINKLKAELVVAYKVIYGFKPEER